MYNYVRNQYAVNPALGAWVFHTETKNWGVITRENKSCSHYVMVRFQGRRHSDPCHPTEQRYKSPRKRWLNPRWIVDFYRNDLTPDREYTWLSFGEHQSIAVVETPEELMLILSPSPASENSEGGK